MFIRRMLAFILFLGLTASPAAGEDPLRLVTLESPPAEYLENGTPVGRNVDIVAEALQRMGHTADILFLPWRRALEMVKQGQAHAIIDAAQNAERAEYLHFPQEPLYVEEWYAFRRAGSDFTLDRDFGNAETFTLGVVRGFEYGGDIQAAIEQGRFGSLEVAANNPINLRKLLGRRCDLILGVKLTMLHLAAGMDASDTIEIVPMTETGEPYLLSASQTFLAFSKKKTGLDLPAEFSQTLARMKAEGAVARLEQPYFE